MPTVAACDDGFARSFLPLFRYLPAYAAGMMEGNASGVMCSYASTNGRPSCANGWLLQQVLRERFGRPDAVVTTDGGAVNNFRGPPLNASSDEQAAAWALNNGSDINDGPEFQHLPSAVAQGLTTEAAVDAALTRSLTQLFVAGLFDPPDRVAWTTIGRDAINSSKHQAINADAAQQSLVLLRNRDATLPLARGARVAVVGPQAVSRGARLSDYASEQPCFAEQDQCIVSIAEALGEALGAPAVTSAAGVDINSADESRVDAALRLASAADVVVLALGTDKTIEGETVDRENITLPGLQQRFGQQVRTPDVSGE